MGIGRDGIELNVYPATGNKRPYVAVKRGNSIVKVATVSNEEGAELLEAVLRWFAGDELALAEIDRRM